MAQNLVVQASNLLDRANTVVVAGPRPARERPLRALALASLVILGSAIATGEAEAQYRRDRDRDQTISAQQFNRYETLAVNEATIGVVMSVNRAEVAPKGGITGRGMFGAVLGGAAGNQVGGGNGRKIATALGAIGGAILGNRSARKNNQEEAVELFVQLPQVDRRGNVVGQQLISVVQSADQDIRPGDQVYVVGNGAKLRIVPMTSDVGPRSIEAGTTDTGYGQDAQPSGYRAMAERRGQRNQDQNGQDFNSQNQALPEEFEASTAQARPRRPGR